VAGSAPAVAASGPDGSTRRLPTPGIEAGISIDACPKPKPARALQHLPAVLPGTLVSGGVGWVGQVTLPTANRGKGLHENFA